MKKYKDSFETQSEFLKSSGKGIVTAAENKDTLSPIAERSPRSFAREDNASVPFVRTLERDADHAVKHGNVSLAGEILATKTKQRAERVSKIKGCTPAPTARRFPFFIVLFLAALLAFGGSFFFFASRQGLPLGDILLIFRPPTISPPPVEDREVEPVPSRSLFTADEEKELVVDGQTDGLAFQSLIENEIAAARSGDMVALIPVEAIQTEGGVFHEKLDPFTLFTMLNLPIYEALSRNVDDYTLGIVGREEASMFLVARMRFFDDGLATMLSWERTMLRDLYGLVHSDSELARGGDSVFRDTAVLNFDARVLTQTTDILGGGIEARAEERDIIAYSIVNKNTLVLASSRERLEDIIERLK